MLIKQSIFKSLALLSHVSDLELFNDAIRSYKEDHPDVRYAGSYRRIMISVSSGEREEISITILRIHHIDPDGIHSYPALIPDILIPYGSYTIRFVLTLLYSYLNRSCTVTDLCARFGIAISTFYDWKHLIESHYASWEKQLLSLKS